MKIIKKLIFFTLIIGVQSLFGMNWAAQVRQMPANQRPQAIQQRFNDLHLNNANLQIEGNYAGISPAGNGVGLGEALRYIEIIDALSALRLSNYPLFLQYINPDNAPNRGNTNERILNTEIYNQLDPASVLRFQNRNSLDGNMLNHIITNNNIDTTPPPVDVEALFGDIKNAAQYRE